MTGKPRTLPVIRECWHARKHQHGTVSAYKSDGCRCTACRSACAVSEAARKRLQAYGRYPTMRFGSVGDARRLQALAVIGWGARALARESGLFHTHIQVVRGGRARYVEPSTHEAITDLYDRLWNRPPPVGSRHLLGSVTRAKRHAEAQGWVPPMAWDDDTIDDPAAKPYSSAAAVVDEVAVQRAVAGHPAVLNRDEKEQARRLMEAKGLSAAEIGRRLGTTARTVVRKRAAS